MTTIQTERIEFRNGITGYVASKGDRYEMGRTRQEAVRNLKESIQREKIEQRIYDREEDTQ